MDAIEPNLTISLQLGEEVHFDNRSGYITSYVDMKSVMVRDKFSGRLERVLIEDILVPKNSSNRLPDNDLSLIPDDSWQLAQDRFNIIEPLLLMDKRTRQDVEERADKFGKHVNTLYQWIKAYENHGNLRSLMNKARKDSGSRRLSTEIEGIIDSCILEHYLTRERKSISYVHRIIVTACHERKIDPPHQNTVRNRINSISERHKVKKRHGGIVSSSKFAPVRGKTPGAETPFAMYQMDHTPMDVIVVDEDDRHAVGRPTLTMIIDVFSRMVAGFYISFEPPSALAAGMCMAHSLLPKTKWLGKFNTSSDWPIWGNPSTLHMDNAGEFRGDMLKLAAGEYQFTIEYRPVARPNYGGHIERLLGTFAQELKSLPGSTFSNTQERGNYQSEKKAALTLSELEEWLTILIVDGYHQKIHSSIGTTPLERFKEGVLGSDTQPGVGMKPKITDDRRVMLDFMPFVHRTISNEGVVIENIHYYHDVLRHWINTTEPTNKKLSRKFVFRRDPRDISTVWFFDPQLKQYFPIPYRDTSRPAVSVWEMRKARKLLLKGQREKVSEHELFNAYERMREIENTAIKKTMSTRRASARKKDAVKKSINRKPQNIISTDISTTNDLPTEDIKPFDDLLEDFDDL